VKPDFVRLDLRDFHSTQKVFQNHKIESIIHFAAKKAVGESVEKPSLYYDVNINSLLNLLKLMQDFDVGNIIFSSSCTVYGQPDQLPVTESTPFQPAASPYGNTKQICEEILRDNCHAQNELRAISLRYFNPIGAHESAFIGELPIGIPNNLVPFITQTAAGIRSELKVFGGDFDTPDGTAIRDYIHVVDLAKAHVASLRRSINNQQKSNYEFFNVGTGKGNSVLEVIKSFEEVTEQKLNYSIVEKRPGDIVQIFADTSYANKELEWEAKKKLGDMMSSAWEWQKKIPSHYI